MSYFSSDKGWETPFTTWIHVNVLSRKLPNQTPPPQKKTWIQYQNHSSQKCTKLEIRFGDIFDIICRQICCNRAKLTCLSGAISSSSSIISSSDIETPQTLTVTCCHGQWESVVWWWYDTCLLYILLSCVPTIENVEWVRYACFVGCLSLGCLMVQWAGNVHVWITGIPRPCGSHCYMAYIYGKHICETWPWREGM